MNFLEYKDYVLMLMLVVGSFNSTFAAGCGAVFIVARVIFVIGY